MMIIIKKKNNCSPPSSFLSSAVSSFLAQGANRDSRKSNPNTGAIIDAVGFYNTIAAGLLLSHVSDLENHGCCGEKGTW